MAADAEGWVTRHTAATLFGETDALAVKDRAHERCMYIGDLCQSKSILDAAGEITTEQPWDLVQIMTLWGAAWAVNRQARSIHGLVAGLGGGSLSRSLMQLLPRASELDSVEVDPAVAAAAQTWMGFATSPLNRVHVTDGREFIRSAAASGQQYDVLFLDMFTGTGIADEVTSKSFLKKTKACLAADGLLVCNLHTGWYFAKSRSFDEDYEACMATLKKLCKRFDHVYRVECWDHQNSIVLCHDGEMADAGDWDTWIGALLETGAARAVCPGFDLEFALDRFGYIGGLGDHDGMGLLS